MKSLKGLLIPGILLYMIGVMEVVMGRAGRIIYGSLYGRDAVVWGGISAIAGLGFVISPLRQLFKNTWYRKGLSQITILSLLPVLPLLAAVRYTGASDHTMKFVFFLLLVLMLIMSAFVLSAMSEIEKIGNEHGKGSDQPVE